MAFRFDFILGVLTSFVFSCSGPLFQFLIYSTTAGYPGWSFKQIMLFQAVAMLWGGMVNIFFGAVKDSLRSTIVNGFFDKYLLLPYSPLSLIFTQGFNYYSAGTLLAGFIATIYCMIKMNIILTFWQVGLFCISLIVGMFLYASILILFCTLTLRLTNLLRLQELVDLVFDFGHYPAEIFRGLVKFVYLAVLPVAVWIYFPTQILLGRLTAFIPYSMAVSVVLFFFSLCLWNMQLKKYTSAGG